jgi:hypothetical protein
MRPTKIEFVSRMKRHSRARHRTAWQAAARVPITERREQQEAAMNDPNQLDTPASDQLPAIVYKAAAGSVVVFVLLAWLFFGGSAHMRLTLAVVSVLFFMALAIPFALWLAWRKQQDADSAQGDPASLRQWAAGEFGTWQGHLKGANAAIEILLPIAATAVGMLAIGIVFYVVSAGAG